MSSSLVLVLIDWPVTRLMGPHGPTVDQQGVNAALRENSKDGWALASLYPPHIRASAQPSAKTNRAEGAGQSEQAEDARKPEET